MGPPSLAWYLRHARCGRWLFGDGDAARPGPTGGGGAKDGSRSWLRHYPASVPASVGPFPEVNAYELLASAARRFPDRPAISWFGRKIAYRELERECARFAGALAGMGIGVGDRVGLILPNCPQYVIAYYAALRLGAIVVGNNPLYSERELSHQLADAGVDVAVVLDSLYPAARGAIASASVPRVVVTAITEYMGSPKKQLAPLKLWREAHAEGRPWPPVARDAPVEHWGHLMRNAPEPPAPVQVAAAHDIAALVYTGGTTGLSKGAMLSHRNLVANAMQSRAWFLDTEDGRESIMSVLPFFHCYGMTVCMNLGMLMAATLVLLPRFELKQVMKEIEHERPSLFPGVPKIYILINDAAKDGGYDLSSIRYCLSGAGALPSAVAEQFGKLTGGRVVEGYGLTEASPVAIGNPLDGSGRAGTIGLPLPDTDCRITDLSDPTHVVPAGTEGELQIRGPQVMLGYRNQPDDTAQVLRDGWLRTGDLATMDEEGFFRIIDRIKDVIKVSGFNVYPTEVEGVLHRNPKVLKACVVGVPDRQGVEMVKAFIVLRDGEEATVEEMLEWCRHPTTGLAAYSVPKAIEFRRSLPESLVGKVLRRVLQQEEREAAAHAAA